MTQRLPTQSSHIRIYWEITYCKFDLALLSLQESLETLKDFKDVFFISLCYYEAEYHQKSIRRGFSDFSQGIRNNDIHGKNHAHSCGSYKAKGVVLSDPGRYDNALIGYEKR